jgi:hypothetical protein
VHWKKLSFFLFWIALFSFFSLLFLGHPNNKTENRVLQKRKNEKTRGRTFTVQTSRKTIFQVSRLPDVQTDLLVWPFAWTAGWFARPCFRIRVAYWAQHGQAGFCSYTPRSSGSSKGRLQQEHIMPSRLRAPGHG